jgi:phosphoribosylglycinamide formyltransferase 1
MKNVAIFASGSGTNAQAIIEHLNNSKVGHVSVIFSNNKDAFVLQRAQKYNIPDYVFSKNEFYNTTNIRDILKEKKIDFIVLAGFLWLIPEYLLVAFPDRIINIHPALLPKYGGKGMYGMKVHEAVINNKEKESGITIHYVNENYDEGNIIFQAKCQIAQNDSPEILAKKIHELEHKHYPKIVEELLINLGE